MQRAASTHGVNWWRKNSQIRGPPRQIAPSDTERTGETNEDRRASMGEHLKKKKKQRTWKSTKKNKVKRR
eukprot:458-Pyramimonas_sp.AAC.1